MRVLCVDHEERSLNEAVVICRENPAVDAVVGLGSAAEVREWFKVNRADFVLIDVELPDKSGIDLAAELREMSPLLPIVFLAEDARLAYEAFRVYPQNYLLKPLTKAALEREINRCLLARSLRDVSHIEVKTFGNFEITVDGSALSFKRSRAKELLALLVDKLGSGISRAQAFTEMWEDREYDRKAQKYFDNILASLVETLREHNISEIIEIKSGRMRIRPELLDCDRYRFDMGDSEAISAYQGIYMYGYSWANWNGGFFD